VSISVDRTIVYVVPSYSEPRPEYVYIKFRYTKQRNARYLDCVLMCRGTAVTDWFEIDVGGQGVAETREYEINAKIINPPTTYTVIFTSVIPDVDVESVVPLSEGEAMILIVYGSPSGKLTIKLSATGEVIKEVSPIDVDGDGFGATFLVIVPETRTVLDLVPSNCKYSVYVVPKNVVLYSKVGLTLVCNELTENREKLSSVIGTISRISVSLSPAPVAVCYISSWDAGV